MPPKQRITREMILEKSFAMFCREGMEAVNARSVAKALNCSTQPIFSYFAGMDDLKNALDQKARDAFEASISSETSQGDPLERSCASYVRFAGEQPCLFAHLFLRMGEAQNSPAMNSELMEAIVRAEAESEGLSLDAAKELCTSLWVFAHGLAAVQASGKNAFSAERVAEMLARLREGLVIRLKN